VRRSRLTLGYELVGEPERFGPLTAIDQPVGLLRPQMTKHVGQSQLLGELLRLCDELVVSLKSPLSAMTFARLL
jgi:hypothetical protein